MSVRKSREGASGDFKRFGFDTSESEDFGRAVKAYDASRFGEAVQLLQQAAERNDVRAQEMLGLMYWYGPRLYGSEVPRSVEQALELLARASAGGSEVAGRIRQTMTCRTLIEPRSRTVEFLDD